MTALSCVGDMRGEEFSDLEEPSSMMMTHVAIRKVKQQILTPLLPTLLRSPLHTVFCTLQGTQWASDTRDGPHTEARQTRTRTPTSTSGTEWP